MNEQLTERLLRRARDVAFWLRMDALRDIHLTSHTGYGDKFYWKIQAGDSVGFYLYPDGSFQIFGTYSQHVSPWNIPMGKTYPSGKDVLGNRGWPRDGTHPLSCLTQVEIDFSRDDRDDVEARVSDVRPDVH